MALYIGETKVEFNLGSIQYIVNASFATPIINTVMLLSSDKYILKDSNGTYLTAKDGE